jgi:hypothetical protein
VKKINEHANLPEEILRNNIRLFPSFVKQWGDSKTIKFAMKTAKEWNNELKRRGLKPEKI